jgi:hypothetical protein
MTCFSKCPIRAAAKNLNTCQGDTGSSKSPECAQHTGCSSSRPVPTALCIQENTLPHKANGWTTGQQPWVQIPILGKKKSSSDQITNETLGCKYHKYFWRPYQRLTQKSNPHSSEPCNFVLHCCLSNHWEG